MSVASLLINEIRDVLQDSNASTYRWSDDTLLRYLSAAQRAIVTLRPKANTIQVLHSVSDSVPRRTLPADAMSMVNTVANAAASGAAHTTPVNRTQLDVLDAVDPEWRYATPTGADNDRYYKAWAHDPVEPKVFWLYPRPANGRHVYVTYVQSPPDVSAVNSTLTLSPQYDAAMTEYVLWRALSSEGRYARPIEHSKVHLDTFATLLGLSKDEYRALVRASYTRDKSEPA